MRTYLRSLILILTLSSSAFAEALDMTGVASVTLITSYTDVLVQFSPGESVYSVESGCPNAVEARREGSVLTLEATLGEDLSGGTCLLTVGLGVQIPVNLVVSNASVTLTGHNNALISGGVANGNLSLVNIPAALLELEVENGTITASSVSGKISLTGANGDVVIDKGTGSVRINRTNSAVTLRQFNFAAGSKNSITTVNRSIFITRCKGAAVKGKRAGTLYKLRAINGSVRVTNKKGRSILRTKRSTTVQEAGKGRAIITAKTTNGSVQVS